jgi:putative AdoMet-dependent methyltransferase
MIELRDNRSFDEWSSHYDEDTDGDSRGYPFAGYREVLATIATRTFSGVPQTIVDVGVGTGKLSAPLYARGCRIIGLDFSTKMLAEAQKRMPGALLIQRDLRHGLPDELRSHRVDHVISSYFIHHFDSDQKVRLLAALVNLIRADGTVVVGDVAFQSRAGLEACRTANLEKWDSSETYLVAEELQPMLRAAGLVSTYTQVSTCAGVLQVKRGP